MVRRFTLSTDTVLLRRTDDWVSHCGARDKPDQTKQRRCHSVISWQGQQPYSVNVLIMLNPVTDSLACSKLIFVFSRKLCDIFCWAKYFCSFLASSSSFQLFTNNTQFSFFVLSCFLLKLTFCLNEQYIICPC